MIDLDSLFKEFCQRVDEMTAEELEESVRQAEAMTRGFCDENW